MWIFSSSSPPLVTMTEWDLRTKHWWTPFNIFWHLRPQTSFLTHTHTHAHTHCCVLWKYSFSRRGRRQRWGRRQQWQRWQGCKLRRRRSEALAHVSVGSHYSHAVCSEPLKCSKLWNQSWHPVWVSLSFLADTKTEDTPTTCFNKSWTTSAHAKQRNGFPVTRQGSKYSRGQTEEASNETHMQLEAAAEEPNAGLYLFINGRWKFLITNPRKPFACPNRWVQRWLASREPPKPRVQTPLLPLLSINIAMQTCLCQLNLFSNFPQGERVALTLRPVCHLSPHNSTCSVHPLFSPPCLHRSSRLSTCWSVSALRVAVLLRTETGDPGGGSCSWGIYS